MNYIRNAAVFSLCLSVTIGCDKAPENPPTYGVSGKVTYKNEAVEGATVVLVAESADGRGAVGNTDAEGNYQVATFAEGDGAVAGEYKVKIFKYEMIAEPPNDGDVMTEEEEEEEYTGEEEVEEGGNLLPSKYEDPQRSGFSVEVTDAPVVLDLDLK